MHDDGVRIADYNGYPRNIRVSDIWIKKHINVKQHIVKTNHELQQKTGIPGCWLIKDVGYLRMLGI